MKDAIFKLIISIMPTILTLVTPEIREMLEDFMGRWWIKAKETPNKFDDFLVKFLAAILKIELPD